MTKFLLLIAVFIIAYLVIQHSSRRREVGEKRPPAKPEDMVRCGVCGIHLPRSEGLTSRGDYYCSEEHLRLAKK